MNIADRVKELSSPACGRDEGRLALESHMALPPAWRGAGGPVLLADVSPISYIAAFREGRRVAGKTQYALSVEIALAMRQYVSDIVSDVGPDACVLAFDSPTPTHRSRFLKAYKAQRAKKKADANEEHKALERARVEAVSRMWADPALRPGCNVLRADGYEADDLIAAFVHAVRVAPDGSRLTARRKVMVATNDSDLCQLMDFANVDMLDVGKRLYVTRESFERTRGYPPAWVPLIKAIGGDVSDNIPGVAGVGEKTALKYVAGKPVTERERGLVEGGWPLVEDFYDMTRLPFPGCSLKGAVFDAELEPKDVIQRKTDDELLPF